MAVTLLVVDDSAFFRQQVLKLLADVAEIEVIGVASHGREAVEKAIKLKPDVITMDYEMPVMDGITAVREIMSKQPTAILMFSSLTTNGARVTLDALDAGAVDYLAKYREDIGGNQLKTALVNKVLSVARKARFGNRPAATSIERTPIRPSVATAPTSKAPARIRKPELIIIGTSTGGPVALQKVLTQIPANFSIPIMLVQHMPAAFTGPFAERLNSLCKINVVEANGEQALKPGLAILAPGGKQFVISGKGRVKVLPGDERLNYKPCVDVSFGSAVKYYGSNVLAVVLTGMGADGREGARMLKKAGSHVWIQDSASCVIDGMPSSIQKAGLADAVVPLAEMGTQLSKL